MALDPALLAQLLGPHPARRMGFAELRAGLLAGAQKKLINISRDGDLELFTYTSTCQFEQQWDLFSLISGGLILDPAADRVVATPFPKFFNFNEGGVALPDEPFEVSEKIDGSLGILFHHNGRWRISTRGDLTSPQGVWATNYLHANVNMTALVSGVTYLTEIIYAENRVVIPYPFEGLVLLAGYDETGVELSRAILETTARQAGLRVATSISCSGFDSLLQIAQQLTRHQEGFVIRYASGLRIKLKGEAYCRIHKLITRCTPLALWEAMANVEDFDAIRRELPEEMHTDFDSIRRLLDLKMQALLEEIRATHDRLKNMSDRDLGLFLQNPASGVSDAVRKFIFACRKDRFFERVHERGELRTKLFRLLRPDRNYLEGYVPSDIMTRFAEDEG